jgi:hypothetical protein
VTIPVRRTLVALLGLLALGSCQGPWYSARFLPAPLEVQLAAEGEPSAQARALLTVVGIRRAADGQPAQVVVRLRLDNMGDARLALVPEGFDCVTSDLVSMGAPSLDADPGEPLASGESRTWTAAFPVPAGRTPEDLDWRGLNLKWTVDFEGRRVTTGVTFDRVYDRGYYDPYYDPYWDGPYGGVNVGVGVTVSG